MTDDSDEQGRRFDIGELAKLAGMQTSALRFYERQGLLRPAGRSNGRRVFDEEGLRQLAAIDFWQEAGFTIKEIAWLINEADGNIETAKEVAGARIAELERLIRQAAHVRDFLTHVLGCVHGRLSDCPYYEQHLRERADRIAAGELQRTARQQTSDRLLPTLPGARRTSGDEPEDSRPEL